MSRVKQNNYLEFENPIHIIWRKGTPEDPYVDRLDIMPVVNQRIILSEIPDKLTPLRIANMKEINHQRFIDDTIEPNEFYCDYTNGFVYFHISKEAETLSIAYKGRGVILYPASRIYTVSGNNVHETLQEVIEKTYRQVDELIERTEDFENYLDNLVVAIGNAEIAAERAELASERAETVANDLEKAYLTTQFIWKAYVPTYDDINVNYPSPQIGWTTQTEDTGIRYRWDGKEWVPIDILSGGDIPLASEVIDGRMSKEDFTKLKKISPQVNQKTIVFVLPQEVLEGVQDPHVVFPYKGEIYDLQVTVSKKGFDTSLIQIEKSTDFETWVSITNTEIELEENKYIAEQEQLSIIEVSENDIFRVNVIESKGIENMSINININLDTEHSVI